MTERLVSYDPAAALVDPEEMAAFLSDALETGDATFVAKALGVCVRAKGMEEVCRQTGISCEELAISFSEEGKLTLATTIALTRVLGLKLSVKVNSDR